MKDKSFLPNSTLKSLGILVGKWNTVGTHPLQPGEKLHGQTEFYWIEGGAFLAMRSSIEHEAFPEGIAIISCDDSTKEGFMIYFDDRGVSRNYKWSFAGNELKCWRDSPGFSQHYSLTIIDNGDTIIGKGELSKDGSTWEKDLELTYKRVK
ncbi:MAG TPA: hypothetical protein VJ954_05510 [Ignavibacteriaceae bacterium]|nr:hypothetical protein [Ignavibacteriaceae bacterium]